MSDESRNVLVVTFEDSAEVVKVCVCEHVCVVCVWCVCSVCACVCVHVCETLLWSFSCVGGSEGIWLITQHIVPSLPTCSYRCKRSDHWISFLTATMWMAL